MTGQPAPAEVTTSSAPKIASATLKQRNLAPRVEEVVDED